jgi:hypothetical protein
VCIVVLYRLDISPFKESDDDCFKVLKRSFAILKDYPHRSSLTHFVLSARRITGITCGGSIIRGIEKKGILLEESEPRVREREREGYLDSELRPQI